MFDAFVFFFIQCKYLICLIPARSELFIILYYIILYCILFYYIILIILYYIILLHLIIYPYQRESLAYARINNLLCMFNYMNLEFNLLVSTCYQLF